MKRGKRSNRCEVLRSEPEHMLELHARVIVLAGFDQSAPEGHAGRDVRRVTHEPGHAGGDSVLVSARAPILLGQCGEGDRCRIVADPAPQFVDAIGLYGHGGVT